MVMLIEAFKIYSNTHFNLPGLEEVAIADIVLEQASEKVKNQLERTRTAVSYI
ncbi:MAG: hypothetical protein FD167_5769 [bacterium]|nr:MAG: hypothetical protein FD167_5769 [bacterium]